jgi:carbon storage regulator
MLVLSRQVNQSIMIGDAVEITVVDIKGDKVRIGINAPSDVSVHRKEVWLAIQEENRQAADPAPEGLDQINRLLEKDRKVEPKD